MTLTIGSLRAEPGQKTRGSLTADLGTTTVEVPLVLVNGSRPGPRVVITGGVHGGEFIGVDAATRLAGLLEPEEVAGQVVICPVANPPAVYGGRLNISPLDGVNINRVFPGDKDGGPTERMAAWLFEHLIDGADAYVDLHSGGIDQHLLDFAAYRLTSDSALDAKNRAMAHAVGYERIIVRPSPTAGTAMPLPTGWVCPRFSWRRGSSATASPPPCAGCSTPCTGSCTTSVSSRRRSTSSRRPCSHASGSGRVTSSPRSPVCGTRTRSPVTR
ncbi:M14 family metallopeptidase [Streptomyces stelliscabiei]